MADPVGLQQRYLPLDGLAGRNAGIDLIRAVGIFLVMGMHLAGTLAVLGQIPSGVSAIIAHAFGHGYYGVTIFFVVSGYLITTTTVRVSGERIGLSAGRFYIRRATRILPLLWFSLLLGSVFLFAETADTPLFRWVFHLDGADFGPVFWLSQMTFSFNWLRIGAHLPGDGWGMHWDILWSLAVEEQFYLLFPLVALLCGSVRRMRSFLLLTVLVSVLLRAGLLYRGLPWLDSFTNTLSCCDALAIGCLTALSPAWPARRARFAGCAGIAITGAAYLVGYKPLFGIMGLAISVGVAMMIQWFRIEGPRENLAGRFGRLSFGLYLLHPAVIFLLMPVLPRLSFVPAFAAFVAVSFLVAQISFAVFESPVERRLRARFLRPSAAASVPRMAEDTA